MSSPSKTRGLPRLLRADRVTTVESLKAANRLGQQSYGAAAPTLEFDLRCFRRYPQGVATLYQAGEYAGSTSIWPVRCDWAAELKAGRRRDLDMHPEADILPSGAKAHCWYWAEMILAPEHRGTGLARVLVREALLAWYGQIGEGPVELHALAVGAASERIFQKLGFTQLLDSSHTPDGWPLYGIAFPGRRAVANWIIVASNGPLASQMDTWIVRGCRKLPATVPL
jgi:GNAT superfamily N-acetyltransferase